MKILLIKPDNVLGSNPIPLGLGYVAQALIKERGDQVEILDARQLRLPISRIAEKIRDLNPDVVGVTALNADVKEAHKIAAAAKAEAPAAKVIFGGPYTSAARKSVLKDENVDATVVSEGEITTVELLNVIEGGGDLSRVPGIIHRDNSDIIENDPREAIQDLDAYSPAWDLLHPEMYLDKGGWHTLDRMGFDYKTLPIFTSRGCPFQCIYCHRIFGKQFRPRSPGSVVDEIQMLKERYNIGQLEIYDDCFNMSRKRAKEIAREIIDRKIDIHITFPCGLRGDRMDDEMLDLFKEAGVFRIGYAIESASPRVQEIIKKNIDLDKVKDAISRTVARDIITVGYFILGFPTETAEEMKMTADYAADSELHAASFFYLNPFPGSEVAKMAGIKGDEEFFWDVVNINVNLSAASDKDLHDASKYAYRKFYLDPVRAWRVFKIMPKNSFFFMNLLLIFRLFFKDSIVKYWK